MIGCYQGETKLCYVVDQANGTRLGISYWNPDAASPTITVEPMNEHSVVTDPVIQQFEVHDKIGIFVIQLQRNGQHAICTNADDTEKLFRFSLDIMFSKVDIKTYNPFEEANENAKDEGKFAINLRNRLNRLRLRINSIHAAVG